MGKTKKTDAAALALRTFGLAYPGAHIKSPWPGHMDLAVNDKTFVYLNVPGEPFKISCKLPFGNAFALTLPFVEPAAYGLGKSGWVTARFADEDPIDVPMLKAWIDESYRAQAPKKNVRALDAGAPRTVPAKAKAKQAAKAPAKKSKPR